MTITAKKQIIRSMTVDEVSTVDRPAQPGAVATIMKSEGASLRKNAEDVAAGSAEPLFKAADYADAMIARSVELARMHGGTPEAALVKHCGTDPELIALARAERAAEAVTRRARNDRRFGEAAA